MCNVRRNGAPIFIVLAALLHPAHAADAKADKKKSQAAYQQGILADGAGQRADAIAAYSAAIAADAANGDAWRAVEGEGEELIGRRLSGADRNAIGGGEERSVEFGLLIGKPGKGGADRACGCGSNSQGSLRLRSSGHWLRI